MNNIWITSDWHFCHNKSFIYEPRNFNNQFEMNNTIIKNFNSIVDINDDVYCLGDIMLNDNEKGIECLKSLKGKIHIICGNHDTKTRIELYQNCHNVVEICNAKFFRHGKYHFFLSHYPALTSNHDDGKSLKTKVISLCGHSHTNDKFCDIDKGLIYHCEVDAHNCYPVNIEQIINDLKEKVN